MRTLTFSTGLDCSPGLFAREILDELTRAIPAAKRLTGERLSRPLQVTRPLNLTRRRIDPVQIVLPCVIIEDYEPERWDGLE